MQQKPHWISAETRRMVESLLDSLEYFQNFLEDTSKRRQHCEKFEELEREIRNAVNEAEDVIELKIYEINEREALSNTFLRTLVQKVDALKREVMSCRFGKYKVLNETTENKALHETFSPLAEKIDAVKRNVMGSSFGTNEVQGYGEPTNEDPQTCNFLPSHSSRYCKTESRKYCRGS